MLSKSICPPHKRHDGKVGSSPGNMRSLVPTGTPGNPLEPRDLSNIWDGPSPQVVTGYRDKFRILPNIFMEVLCFVYFDISIAIIRYIYIYSFLKKTYKKIVFFNPSICNEISLLVISIDNKAGVKLRGRLASNNHC